MLARRKASWWRGKLLAEDVALATTQRTGEMLGVTEHLCSQLGSGSGGGGGQEFASVQAQLSIEALPSPEELSLKVTALMFVSAVSLCPVTAQKCLCPSSAQGERKTLQHDNHRENRSNKYSPAQAYVE